MLLVLGMFFLGWAMGAAAPGDDPVVTVSGVPLAYTENDAATVIDGGITVTEPNAEPIQSAEVQFTANYVNGEDVLGFTNQLGITGSWSSAAGRLTLTGPADAADFETAMRTITYVNTSDNPSTSTRTVRLIATDGTFVSSPVTVDIQVTAVNDVPVVSTTAGSLAYTESSGAVVADTGVTVSDPDSNITGATVTVTGNYVNGEDVLAFADQLGITGSWDAGTGTLTLTGTTSDTDYQTALRAVTYENTSNNPSTLPRSLTFQVSDGTASNAPVRVIAINAVNDPPSPGGDTNVTAPGGGPVSILEDAPDPGAANIRLTVPVLSDVEGPAPSQVRISSVTGGTLLQSDGSLIGLGSGGSLLTLAAGSVDLRFWPDADRDVDATFEYLVVDGANAAVNSDPSTATISITPVNDAPVLGGPAGTVTFTENDPATAIDAGLTASDVDDANLEGATIAIGAGYVNGEDVLAFTDQLGITGSWDAGTGTLALSGSAPLADYESALRSVTFENPGDAPTGGARTISIVVTDGTDPSGLRSRTVDVVPVNDAPTATTSGGAVAYTENDPATVVDGAITVSDPDTTDLVGATVSISGNFAAGEDVLAFSDQLGIGGSWDGGAGVLTLSGSAPLADYQSALATITYQNTSDDPSTAARAVSFVVDDGTDTSAPATRSIAITSVNDPSTLVATAGGISVVENDGPAAVDSGLAIVDLDDDNLAGATVVISAGYWNGEDELGFTDQLGITGSWDAGTGTLTLTGAAPPADYETAIRSVTYTNTSDDPHVATRTVEFSVDDGTNPSNTVSRTVDVTPVNDLPTATLAGSGLTFTEGDSWLGVDNGLTVEDLDDAVLERARVRIGSHRSGEDEITVTLSGGLAKSWDAAAGQLTVYGVAPPSTYETVLRTLKFRNTSNDPVAGPRAIQVTLDDGTGWGPAGSRTITVVAVNDPPVARDDQVTMLQGTTADVDVLDNDTDADSPTLTIDSVVAPGNVSATITSGKLRVTPSPGYSGRLEIVYAVSDGEGGADEATLTVSVTPVADLSVVASVGPDPVFVGGSVTALVEVRNAGPGTAAAPLLSLSAGPAATVTDADDTCIWAGGEAVCWVGDLAAGGSRVLSIRIRPDLPGTMTGAVVGWSGVQDPDDDDLSQSFSLEVVGQPSVIVTPPPSGGSGGSGRRPSWSPIRWPGGGSATTTTTSPATTTTSSTTTSSTTTTSTTSSTTSSTTTVPHEDDVTTTTIPRRTGSGGSSPVVPVALAGALVLSVAGLALLRRNGPRPT